MQNTLEYSGDLKAVPKIQHCPAPKPLAHYAKTYDGHQQAMAAACLSGGFTMKSIADEVGVHNARPSPRCKSDPKNISLIQQILFHEKKVPVTKPNDVIRCLTP